MGQFEAASFWASTILYGLATVAVFAALVWKKDRWVVAAAWVALAGLAVHTATIVARWQAAGHFPYVGQYENVLVAAWMMVFAYLLVVWRWRNLSLIGAVVLPTVVLTLGYGVTVFAPAGPVTPPYQSSWLVVHVTFAWVTYAVYSIVAGLGLALVIRKRAERQGVEAKGIPSWVPESDRIDDMSLKLVAFGFLNNAIMIASGAIWAHNLWGSYWSWDPVETWSLLTWLAYGFYMHARLTLGWRGERLAWVAMFALFGVMMTFWGVQFAPTSYHLFRDIGSGMFESSRPM